MQSKATTVAEYLAALPADRRAALSAVRDVIRANLDRDFEERMSYGMIGYCIPHSVYPAGYHCDPNQPLPYLCLASQKGHMSLHLMGVYIGEVDAHGETAESKRFRAEWAKTGKKLDMGKACVRFKKLEDVALDVLADAIRRLPAKEYIARYEAVLARSAPARKGAAAKGSTAAAKKTTSAKSTVATKAASRPARTTSTKTKAGSAGKTPAGTRARASGERSGTTSKRAR